MSWLYHTKQMYECALEFMKDTLHLRQQFVSLGEFWPDALDLAVVHGLQEPNNESREWVQGELAKFLIWTTDVDKILEVYHTILDYELDPGDLIRGIAVTHHLLHENRQLHIAAAKVYIRRYTPYENGNEPVRRSFVANLVRLHNRQDLIPLYQADLAGIYGGFWGELEFLR